MVKTSTWNVLSNCCTASNARNALVKRRSTLAIMAWFCPCAAAHRARTRSTKSPARSGGSMCCGLEHGHGSGGLRRSYAVAHVHERQLAPGLLLLARRHTVQLARRPDLRRW
jgi:hypothetical protein